jgi:DNA-binding transcriptional ArsR family regulator
MKGGEQFEWSPLAAHLTHPLKVAVVEALSWVEQPLSPSDLVKLIDRERYSPAHVSYHLGKLANAEALRVVGTPQARGATERLYSLA